MKQRGSELKHPVKASAAKRAGDVHVHEARKNMRALQKKNKHTALSHQPLPNYMSPHLGKVGLRVPSPRRGESR